MTSSSRELTPLNWSSSEGGQSVNTTLSLGGDAGSISSIRQSMSPHPGSSQIDDTVEDDQLTSDDVVFEDWLESENEHDDTQVDRTLSRDYQPDVGIGFRRGRRDVRYGNRRNGSHEAGGSDTRSRTRGLNNDSRDGAWRNDSTEFRSHAPPGRLVLARPTPPVGGGSSRRSNTLGHRERDLDRGDGNQSGGNRRRIRPLPRRGGVLRTPTPNPDGSDDDEGFAITGENIRRRVNPQRQPAPRIIRDDDEFRNVISNMDSRLAAIANQIAALHENDDVPPRRAISVNPEPRRQRIGLGGAVLRSGNRQINYQPNRNSAAGFIRAAHFPVRTTRRGALHADNTDEEDYFDLDDSDEDDAQLLRELDAQDDVRHYISRRRMVTGAVPAGGVGTGNGGGTSERNGENVQEILTKVDPPISLESKQNFTHDFDMDISKLLNKEEEPIIIDDEGIVIPPTSRGFKKKKIIQPYLACVKCSEPLLISSAYSTCSDKVWALRCGHLIDQKCLNQISKPTTPEDWIGIERIPLDDKKKKKGVGKRRSQRNVGSWKGGDDEAVSTPLSFSFLCPVEGCGFVHWALEVVGRLGDWEQKEGEGALPVFA